MSDEKKLPIQSGSNKAVQLHDNGPQAASLIEQSLRNLSHDQAKNLMAKAAEEALRLEVKNREQNADYAFGKKAAQDHVDTFNMLDKSNILKRQNLTSDIKTGAGNMRIESKSGATCFVASVAYGDPNHPDVMFLRWYRDTVLTHNIAGRSFIGWYWKRGPKLAQIIKEVSLLQSISRLLVGLVVKLLRRVYCRD